jgi:hypothetical protein
VKTYYVLWVPTLSELKHPFYCREEVNHKLEDSKCLGGYHLKGRIDSSLDIEIEYRRTGVYGLWEKFIGKKPGVIRLHKESDILKRGFVQYSSELPETELDEFQKGLCGVLKSPIYHFIKEFFHNHTHHHASQDSLLQAYASQEMVDLNARYEEITLHYIHQYRDLLIDFNEETSEQIVLLKNRLNHARQVKQSINALGDIVKAGNDLKGQLGYMDFLIQRLARPYSIPKGLRNEIELLRNTTRQILDDANTSYNVSTAALGIKYGIQGIRFGCWGIIVSCALFAISTYITCSNHTIEDAVERAKQEIIKRDSTNYKQVTDSIRNDVSKVKHNIDKLQKEVRKQRK